MKRFEVADGWIWTAAQKNGVETRLSETSVRPGIISDSLERVDETNGKQVHVVGALYIKILVFAA